MYIFNRTFFPKKLKCYHVLNKYTLFSNNFFIPESFCVSDNVSGTVEHKYTNNTPNILQKSKNRNKMDTKINYEKDQQDSFNT